MQVAMERTEQKRLVDFLEEELRKRRGADLDYDKTRFAHDIGIPYSVLSNWLARGAASGIKLEYLRRLLEYFGPPLARALDLPLFEENKNSPQR